MSAGSRIVAERVVAAPPSVLFSFLADLENHWQLADRFVEVLTLERPSDGGPAHGGMVRMKGPLGLGRTARTRVVEAHPPDSVAGTASIGPRTQARVSWTLVPHETGTRVRLEAEIERAGLMDAVLLAVGGRAWLRNRFVVILETLARRVVASAGQPSSA